MMKIKLISFQTKHGKYEREFYGVEIGGSYEVMRQYESGGVSIKTPSGRELPLFTSEFEYIMEA
ncbi:hypothetical protein bas03_0061 [Escherichia phage JulesPiccard]|uniref:Uncharacterized protein n=1 Tax=Escherichia phage JulesPiccard TaxID=2851956 RepID=A0AAE7VVG5_9CAUD|nr:hypothetical protein bas03_0061 [Escherichia phage JulesPiccard]